MQWPRRDAAATIALAICATLQLAVGPRTHLLDVPAAALLFFALTGASIVSALFRPEALDPVRRALLVPALSVCSSIVAGVALGELNVPLTRANWAYTLGSGAVVVSSIALLRRGRKPVTAVTRSRRRPFVGRRGLALAGATLVLIGAAVGSLALSVRPIAARHVAGYAALALTPAQDGRFRVFVQSKELKRTAFRLVVRTSAGTTLRSAAFELPTNGTWSAKVSRPPGSGILMATLMPEGSSPDAAPRVVRVRYRN